MNDHELLDKALRYATLKHDGQTRQDAAQTPYITHPIEVAGFVKLAGGSVFAQILAVLHDTLEDTDATFEELVELFGMEIAVGVQALTDSKEAVFERLKKEKGEAYALEVVNDSKKLKREFKVQQAVDMPNKSVDVRTTKIADKVSNVKSLVENPPSWSVKSQLGYALACKAVVDAGRGTNKYLEDLFDRYFAEAKRILEENGKADKK